MLTPQIPSLDSLFTAQQAGTLTAEKYAELEKQALLEVEAFTEALPDEDRWMKADLVAEITRYAPKTAKQRAAS